MFAQLYIQTQIKENIKALRHWPLCGDFTGPVNSLHKWPVTRKMFPFDDVIMQLIRSAAKHQWETSSGWGRKMSAPPCVSASLGLLHGVGYRQVTFLTLIFHPNHGGLWLVAPLGYHSWTIFYNTFSRSKLSLFSQVLVDRMDIGFIETKNCHDANAFVAGGTVVVALTAAGDDEK